MAKEKRQKKSAKRITAVLLIFLLPILSLAIGFFGIQFIMDKPQSAEPIEDTTVTTTKSLLEKEVSEEIEPKKAETVNQSEITTDKQEDDLLTYQMPSISTYNIQVGSYNEVVNANKMSSNVNAQGYGAYVYKSDVYKVFIMSFFDRGNAEVNKVISEQTFNGAYISEILLQPKEIKYSEIDENYIHVLKKDVDVVVEILSSFTKYVHTFQLSSFDQDDFSVYLITQHNEITKLKDKILSEEVSDSLKEHKSKLISYLERLEKQFEQLINIENPTQEEIWNKMIEIIFDYANLA